MINFTALLEYNCRSTLTYKRGATHRIVIYEKQMKASDMLAYLIEQLHNVSKVVLCYWERVDACRPGLVALRLARQVLHVLRNNTIRCVCKIWG